jgi:tetratricopeptide (TPR) repeat protein
VAHLNLGRALSAKGRPEEAIGHFEQALRIKPKSAAAYSELIFCLPAAASAAVRAAAAQGPESGQLGEHERASKRRQALGWLRTSLERITKVIDAGNNVDWSFVTWQSDPAFASVREPQELAKLPDAERKQWQRLWVDAEAIIPAIEQGRAYAARRKWAKAADAYARAFERGPVDDGHFCFEHAAVLLLCDDRPGYARTCARMVELSNKPGGPRAYHVARTCTLAPDAIADASLHGHLAEKELKDSAREFWSLTEQGALAYRTGRFQQAVPFFEQSLQADPRPGRAVLNWLWLALANQRLGKAEEARRWLEKAQAWLDQYGDGMPARAEEELGLHFHNWLEGHVLRREAEALMPSTGFRSGPENRERGAAQK